jgi:large subunit ribosomal protein L23|mmetsp:Transcript_29505/g.54070  ORF Transcript_29505/g.54070 Transcript_29505/m.54070 type:complete len:130 (-) Transcript_29505:128-517(-)
MAFFASKVAMGFKTGFKMWMPNMPITFMSAKSATVTHPATAIFRVVPRMTKHEIKEYLTKIYNLPVKKVNTINYAGKRKRAMGKRRTVYYKYKAFKKAIVTFDRTLLEDVGKAEKFDETAEEEQEQEVA